MVWFHDKSKLSLPPNRPFKACNLVYKIGRKFMYVSTCVRTILSYVTFYNSLKLAALR